MAETKTYDFFISYRRANNGTVCGNYIAGLLRGYSVFYDVSSITEGQFHQQIRDALQHTERFILIVTEGAFARPEIPGKRDWYYEEIDIAIQTVGLQRITPVVFSGALREDLLPISLKNRGLCGCQKVLYVPEYADYFEDKFYKHLHISPNNIGIGRNSTIAPPTENQISDDTEHIDAIYDVKTEKIPYDVCGVGFNMVFVEGGTFSMGATPEQRGDANDNEKLVSSVTLSDYYIGETQVTQGLWKAVMGSNPSFFKHGDNCPVENVSWNEVQDFIEKLNANTGNNFCLPTEAQWEYAARGGVYRRGLVYSGANNIDEVGWHIGNSNGKTHSVKQKKPNELGIYDMSGNVWEWCQDWYGAYPDEAVSNPRGEASGAFRVLRGGSWYSRAINCRISDRNGYIPERSDYNAGFRLAINS
ncbi:MAG: SUMF1/EgtB/PvdO family nonheme iron enzyme [Bacteroidales bacterium]|nr:SUMF1/EgtB/PvdO family nonheme iron enzyme [Bacteroidales bacterium]